MTEVSGPRVKQESTDIFFELTRSICPTCKKTIDAQILFREGKVVMRKRCADHGWFEALLSSDADWYVKSLPYNKPGTIPLGFSTEVVDGCPTDCGLCPEHKQHTCLGLIEVNSHCNLDCPICFANAQKGFSLTVEQVGRMLDRFVELEGEPEVVQFSGGEPTIHPDILTMLKMARDRKIPVVMLNTNGIRIATDDKFVQGLKDAKPTIYLQFDGFERQTHEALRGADLLKLKLKALDRCKAAKLDVVLVPTIERGVNDKEIGDIVRFGIKHPAVRGIAFQPTTHSGRFEPFDPLNRMTVSDVISGIADQASEIFQKTDFIPVPCCHPTCRAATYAFVEGGKVTPLPRVVEVDKYLDYIANRTLPDIRPETLKALEEMWSASAVPGSLKTAMRWCIACNIGFKNEYDYVKEHVFMIVVQGFADAYTMDLKALMKCCVGELIPDGRIIPFCAYNTVGYREKVRTALEAGEMQ